MILAARRYLPEDEKLGSRRVDLLGVAALSAAIVLVLLPLALGRSEGWPTWTWLSLAAGAPALMAFIAVERRIAATGGAPLINLHAIGAPAVSWRLSAVAAATSTHYALLFTLALYLQQGLGCSPLVSGLTLISWVAAFGVGGQIVRRLSDRGVRWPRRPATRCSPPRTS